MPKGRQTEDLQPLWAEFARLARLGSVERALRETGWSRVAGADEAGRGCFAGPVVAAAVILPSEAVIPGLDDSKKLDERSREAVRRWIESVGADVSVAIVGADVIDRDNILEATRQATMEAIRGLSSVPDLVVTDALPLPDLAWPAVPLVRADSRVAAVAAASIIAKTTRDRLMGHWHRRYPWYGFDRNRGYGTAEHREAIRRHGPSPIHRLSFRGVLPWRDAA